MPDSAPERLRAAHRGGVDAITLTSGSTARNLVAAPAADALPAGILIVCIGDQTAESPSAGLHGPRRRHGRASMEGLVARAERVPDPPAATLNGVMGFPLERPRRPPDPCAAPPGSRDRA